MTSSPGFRRGDVVIAVFSRDYGKPRPAVVVQSDMFNATHASVVLCPISSELTGLNLFRVKAAASKMTGIQAASEIMVDKMGAVAAGRIRQRIGRLSPAQMEIVDSALRLWLDLPQAIA
jgi:mRNA interferase MazF